MANFEITLFVGLPGSGKTYWANKLCDIVVDDITELDQLPSKDSIENKPLGITDVNFCNSNLLSKAIVKLQEVYGSSCLIDIVYFENSGKKARNNVKYRNDGRLVEGTIRHFEMIYDPPFGALKIWEP